MYRILYNFFLTCLVLLFAPILLVLVSSSKKYRYIFRRRLFPEFNLSSDEKIKKHRIWVHALSVGEVFSAVPLVKEIMTRNSKISIIFTVSTRTGYTVANKSLASYVSCIGYFPYDIPCLITRVIRNIAPSKVVFVETDLWPNLLYLLKKFEIPSYVINVKISDASYRRISVFKGFARYVSSLLNGIAVQNKIDKDRLLEVGVSSDKIRISGNLKFDQKQSFISDRKKKVFTFQLGLSSERPVWVAGSTHRGEERIILNVLENLFISGINPILIIAPRDIRRSNEVHGIFSSANIKFSVKKFTNLVSHNEGGKIDVIIVDKIGVLKFLYYFSDIAFVGGSMVKDGGHNMLEPALFCKPILFGPYVDDFYHIAKMLREIYGGMCVENAEDLIDKASFLLKNSSEARKIGNNAFNFLLKHRGSTCKMLDFLRI